MPGRVAEVFRLRNVVCDAPASRMFGAIENPVQGPNNIPVDRLLQSETSATCQRYRRPPCLQSFHPSCLHNIRNSVRTKLAPSRTFSASHFEVVLSPSRGILFESVGILCDDVGVNGVWW